ncbi:aminoglycoside phosphotransferase family protein [Kitasatospora sp. NPDC127111]|uniref:aminoglycoside phosphotransferase family protein n=1 Tax=Kitasatospora sp. NPDC127111 TaxID=3345363 RepID=UPI003633865B
MSGGTAGGEALDDVLAVPAEVRARLVVRFGPWAEAWCEGLPALVTELAARWGLTVRAAGGGGTSRVFRCSRTDGDGSGDGVGDPGEGDGVGHAGEGDSGSGDRGEGGAGGGADGGTVWLKLTPDPEVARQEAVALRAWAGLPSVVRLLEYEPAAHALLLADVRPGVTLRQRGWRAAEVAPLLGALRSVPVDGLALAPLAERVEFLLDLTERRAPGAVSPGARAFAGELAASGPVALVHGDLHPSNVLAGPAGPVAIDPRPSLGDPDFDLVDWVIDGVTDLPALEHRIARLTGLVPGADPERVRAWCRAAAVIVAAPRAAAGRQDRETAFLLELAGL